MLAFKCEKKAITAGVRSADPARKGTVEQSSLAGLTKRLREFSLVPKGLQKKAVRPKKGQKPKKKRKTRVKRTKSTL